MPVAGSTVVVTGAGSGIGRAFAQRLSAQGSPVAIVDVDEAGLGETAASLAGPVLSRVLDVRDREGQMRFAADVAAWAPKPIGMVFNNAGVALAAFVAESAPEDHEWLLSINFGGVVNGVRAFLPILLEQDSGVIVNMSSVFGLVGAPSQSAYCAAKFAVRGFTESLRHELRGTGVRAVLIIPGGVKTNLMRHARVRSDPRGYGRSSEEIAAEFEQIARSTPARAAEIIHRGVEAGKPRIFVGYEARAVDIISRVAPIRYFGVLDWVQRRAERQAGTVPARPSADPAPSGRRLRHDEQELRVDR
jgi:NADP-dependent 3-hydroxy acid dehydrogenase YdfG